MKKLLFILAIWGLLMAACEDIDSKEKSNNNDTPDDPTEEYEDIRVVDGRVHSNFDSAFNPSRPSDTQLLSKATCARSCVGGASTFCGEKLKNRGADSIHTPIF